MDYIYVLLNQFNIAIIVVSALFVVYRMAKLRAEVLDDTVTIEKYVHDMKERMEKLEKEVLERLDSIEYQMTDVSDDEIKEFLSDAEIDRLNRHKKFEERIRRIKKDVDSYKTQTRAEELHPGVKNLPHEIIQNKQDVTPIEYAE